MSCRAQCGVTRAMQSRILIVDDDPRLSEMVSEYLGNAGLRATVAPTGSEGLALLAR